MRYLYKTTPYLHQHRALKRALKQGHLGVLWEPGLGKTKLIVDWSSALFLAGKASRILIVCPLSVVGVWEDEYLAHCPVPYKLTIFDKTTTRTPRHRTRRLQVLVVNYDIAWRRKDILEKFEPQFVVADESHRIKKPSARRSWYLRSLNKTKYRAILTGTPNPKSFLDFYSQWIFLNRKRFGTNVNDYKADYIRYGGYMNKVVRGYRNVEELRSKIRADADIKRKDQCLDLPERTYLRVPVYLEDKAWDAYAKMAYELFLELKGGDVSDAKNVAVKIMRLQQITGGWLKSDEGVLHRVSKVKLIACKERLEDLWNDNERVVVFARFRAEVEAIRQLGVHARLPTHVLRGGIGREDRDKARRQFQTQAGPSLFVAQIQSGGLGITLHAAAEVIFYSVTYALDDYLQACDRVHRIGQTRNVTYQHLSAVNTIDLDIYAALRSKHDLMNLIMGGRAGRMRLARSLAKNLGVAFDE